MQEFIELLKLIKLVFDIIAIIKKSFKNKDKD